jgi:hypothetical protein
MYRLNPSPSSAGVQEPPPDPLRGAIHDLLQGLGADEQRLVLEEAAKARKMLDIQKRLAELEERTIQEGGTRVSQTFRKKVKNAPGGDQNFYYSGEGKKKK